MRAINAAKKSAGKRDGRQRTPIASVASMMLNDSAKLHATEKALSPKARQAARASARRNAKAKGKNKAKRVIGHRLKTQAPPGGVSTISIAHGAENSKSTVLQKGAHRATSHADHNESMHADFASPNALNPIARRKQLGGAQMASIFGSMSEPTFSSKPQNVSSNGDASAAHVNYGDSIPNRTTTRVNAPPGGKSQISFGRNKSTRQISRRERHEQQEKHQQRMQAAHDAKKAAKKAAQLPRQKHQKKKQKVTPLRTGGR